jgi:tetratricopeptide (TPR) repeat protein
MEQLIALKGRCARVLLLGSLALVLVCQAVPVRAEHPVEVQRAFEEQRYLDALVSYVQIPTRRRTAHSIELAFESAWALGIHDVALGHLTTLEETFPRYFASYPELLLKRAVVEYQAGYFDRAKTSAERLWESKASAILRGEGLALASEIARRRNDNDLSIVLAEKAVSLLPANRQDEPRLLAALGHYNQGHLDLAGQHLRQIAPDYPQVGRALRLLIEVALKQGDFAAASVWLEEGLRIVKDFQTDSWIDYVKTQVAIANSDKDSLEGLLAEVAHKYPDSDSWRVLLEAEAEQFFWVLNANYANPEEVSS